MINSSVVVVIIIIIIILDIFLTARSIYLGYDMIPAFIICLPSPRLNFWNLLQEFRRLSLSTVQKKTMKTENQRRMKWGHQGPA